MNRTQRLNHRLAFLCMLAPDNGGGSGGQGGKLTLEEQLTQSRTDLATAQGSVQSLTKERDDAVQERDTARTNATTLQGQFDALNTEATTLKSDLATAKETISSLTTERDQLKTASATKDSRIANLESLCKIKGIDSASAPAAIEEPVDDAAKLREQLNSTTDPLRRGVLANQLRALTLSAKV